MEKMRWDLRSDGQVSPSRYMRLMRDSKFCLHVRGTRVQSPRLIEGMLFGCVPVILADGYAPPLSWLFDWSKFSVRLPEVEHERLPEVLQAANWATLHENLRRVAPFFVYHRTPIPATRCGRRRWGRRGRSNAATRVGGGETEADALRSRVRSPAGRGSRRGGADRGSRRVRRFGRRLMGRRMARRLKFGVNPKLFQKCTKT